MRVNKPRHGRATAVLASAIALTVLAAVAACGGSGKSAGSPTPAAITPTITSTPTATPSGVSPFTGLPGASGSVLAVKIDNTDSALPHVGLNSADVVYVEEVEGGLTRIAAIYASHKPSIIAPIRSARETDTELLPMYGHIPLAFSGSVAAVHVLVAKNGLIDVSEDKGELGYYRLGGRFAPYNLAGEPTVLVKRSRTKVEPRDVGFTFGALPAGGRVAKTVSATFPSARISFTYRPSTQRWTYSLNGRIDQVPGKSAASASDILIPYVRVGTTGRLDKVRNPVPFTYSVGRGKGVILRNGRAYNVTWARTNKTSPMVFTYKGASFPLLAGQPWVVMVPRTSPVRITH